LKDGVFIFAAGMIVLVTQITLFRMLFPALYKPDLAVVLVVWTALRLSAVVGILFAFSMGLGIDLTSGAPMGLFSLIYSVVFVTCGYLNSTFDMDTHPGRAAAVFGATLLAGATVLFTRWVAGAAGFGSSAAGLVILRSSITCAVALVLFPGLDRAWAGYHRLLGVR
jgi:rod shape-determining protein MreD